MNRILVGMKISTLFDNMIKKLLGTTNAFNVVENPFNFFHYDGIFHIRLHIILFTAISMPFSNC